MQAVTFENSVLLSNYEYTSKLFYYLLSLICDIVTSRYRQDLYHAIITVVEDTDNYI